MAPGVVIARKAADRLRHHLGKLGLDFGKRQVADDGDIDNGTDEARRMRVEERSNREQQTQASERHGENAAPAFHQPNAETGNGGEGRKTRNSDAKGRPKASWTVWQRRA